jgi:flavin reductase (DIM6/NTAB) family NADH-FMN oxidoreductase RutF
MKINTEKKLFNAAYFEKLEKQNRVHLINSIGGFKSVVLVGTKDADGLENLAVFSSLVHIGANPPLVALIFRPSPPERDTLRNLLATGFYTINHVNESIYKQAHQTSARFDKNVSEFEEVGLTPEYKNNFFAPFVAESNVQLGITFKDKVDIQINDDRPRLLSNVLYSPWPQKGCTVPPCCRALHVHGLAPLGHPPFSVPYKRLWRSSPRRRPLLNKPGKFP